MEEKAPEPDPELGNTTSFPTPTTGTAPKKDNKEKLVKPIEESREAPPDDDSRGVRAMTGKFHEVDPYGEVVLLLRNTGTPFAVWVEENGGLVEDPQETCSLKKGSIPCESHSEEAEATMNERPEPEPKPQFEAILDEPAVILRGKEF